MDNTQNTPLQKKQIVTVKVAEVLPGGLKVLLLENGRSGFVPRKEISWNRSLRTPIKFPKPGEEHDAVVIDQTGKYLRLSLKQVIDPWENIIKQNKYRHDDIVTGEVVNVRNNAAYVQLEPGIDAILYPREASFILRNITDVLFPGDKIRAKIVSCDLSRYHIEISIIKALYLSKSETSADLLKKFTLALPPEEKLSSHDNAQELLSFEQQSEELAVTPVRHPLKRILLVDDEERWLSLSSENLERIYGARVDTAKNSDDGWDKIEQGIIYDVVVIDIQLYQEDGRDFAAEIKQTYPDVPVLLISRTPQDIKNLQNEYGHISFATKSEDLSAITKALDQIRLGRTSLTGALETGKNLMPLSDNASKTVTLAKSGIQNILEWLRHEISADYCILVSLDNTSQEINIIDSAPVFNDQAKIKAQDGLFFSPARQIIEDARSMIKNDVDCEHDRRYKNFFPTLYFHSFAGFPLHIPGEETRYALIILHEDPGKFAKQYTISQCRIDAHFLALTLERLSMLDVMQRYQYTHTMGMLLGIFVHEMAHRLDAMKAATEDLEKSTSHPPDWENPRVRKRWAKQMISSSAKIRTAYDSLEVLNQAYSQEINLKYDIIDIHDLLDEVIARFVQSDSSQIPTEIIREYSAAPLVIKAVRENLKQVFTNLLLNAVQLINQQQRLWRADGRQTHRHLPYRNGKIIIQTLYNEDRSLPVEIYIIDNGPGIYWQEQERIFEPHFSRRGGAGLGLYISQNIIQRIGGRLTLADSILFEGSVFRVELPTAEEA